MCKDGTRVQETRFGASTRWLVYGLFVAFCMGGYASATVITDSFIGFPPDPFVQQDKTWGNWTDIIGNLPTGFTTLVTTRPNIVSGQDLHTFTLSAAFLPDTTYAISYHIMVNTANVGIIKAGAGVVQTVGGATITTVFTNVPFSLPATSTSTGLMTIPLGPWTLLNVTDTIQTGSGSDISGFSNSFLEQLPAPEPGAMALFGTGVLALAAFARRRSSKQ